MCGGAVMSSEPRDGLDGDADVLGLRVHLERMHTALVAHAAVLHAAEGHAEIAARGG
jgi:hypothetical protein